MSFPAAQPDSLAIDDKDADSRTENVGLSTYAAPHGTPDPAVLRRATLKLDFICLGSITFFYLLSFLDRTNIGSAKVAGLQADLKMTDYQYAVAITVTYVPYICAELPATLILKRVGANLMIPLLVVGWGIATLAQGFVKDFGGLVTCRFFIGLFEGAFTPGVTLILSEFYRPRQLQLRLAMFFSMVSMAGAFGGCIAYGITTTLGRTWNNGSYPGWCYIFFIEGAITIGAGLFVLLTGMIPRSPGKAWWLKPAEKDALLTALRNSGSAYQDTASINLRDSLSCLTSNTVILLVLPIYLSNGFIVFGTAFFTPSIVNGFGFSPLRANLMVAPPYALAFVVTVVLAILGDRYGKQALVMVFGSVFMTIGYSMQFALRDNTLRYVGLFFQIVGIAVMSPAANALTANNASGVMRRAVAISAAGMTTSLGAIGSSWVYPTRDGPYYRTGSITGISAGCISIVSALSLAIGIPLLNAHRDRKLAALSASEKPGLADGVLDDRDIRFRFIA